MRARKIIALLRCGVEEAVDGEAIERIGDRLALAHDPFDRERCGVVVVVVAAAAVPAVLVKLANQVAVAPAIVERVEDRDSVGGKRHRTAHESAFAEDGRVRNLRIQWDLPRVGPGVGLRKRHLLLPCADAHHHLGLEGRMWEAIRLDVEPTLVEACLHEWTEGIEDCGLRRFPYRILHGDMRQLRGMPRRCQRYGCARQAPLVDCADLRDARIRVGTVVIGEVREPDRLHAAGSGLDRHAPLPREEE